MRITLCRYLICTLAALSLSACNISDDEPPQVGNNGGNNGGNNTAANSSTVNNTSPNGGTTDAGSNTGTGGCTTDDLSVCPAVTGAEASECIDGICIYQCQSGLYDENMDLDQPGSDGCESDCVPTNDGTEICDSLDNDCNGVVDDGFGIGNTCSSGMGACEANGRIACDPDGVAVCDANPGTPGDEVCDGLDNDCDGEVDEDNPGAGGNCDTGQPGACQNGTETCSGGMIVCEPDNQPVNEACGSDNTGDRIDNDCDGEVDEGCSGSTNCSPACRQFENCCSTDGGRSYSCYGRPPINALCEARP